jgi:hypothetical protein
MRKIYAEKMRTVHPTFNARTTFGSRTARLSNLLTNYYPSDEVGKNKTTFPSRLRYIINVLTANQCPDFECEILGFARGGGNIGLLSADGPWKPAAPAAPGFRSTSMTCTKGPASGGRTYCKS